MTHPIDETRRPAIHPAAHATHEILADTRGMNMVRQFWRKAADVKSDELRIYRRLFIIECRSIKFNDLQVNLQAWKLRRLGWPAGIPSGD